MFNIKKIHKSLLVVLILLLFFLLYAFNGPKQQYRVLGIGSPCLDIFIPVKDKFMTSISGKKGGSKTLSQSEFSKIIGKFNKNSLKRTTGGSCCNTLKGLANLDQRCALLGRFGNDEAAEYVLETFKTLGLIPKMIASSTPTAQVLCFVTEDHERTMRCYLGASAELCEDDLDPSCFEGVELVHIEGYTLYNGGVAKKAMQLAKANGAKVSFDLGSHELVKQFKETLLEIIPNYVDILFGNSDEYFALTGLPSEQACDKVQKMCKTAVVLVGPKGCFIGSEDNIFHSQAYDAAVVDTTGAGDLFISGFLYGYIEGKPLQDCASLGNLLGSTVVQAYGAEIPKNKWEELRKEISNKAALTKN